MITLQAEIVINTPEAADWLLAAIDPLPAAGCDRCYNQQPFSRGRLPVDPGTFCESCQKETLL
jgi:hypothetical protein